MSSHLYGIHDRGSWERMIPAAGVTAWCLITEEISPAWAWATGPTGPHGDLDAAITPVIRLNYGYGSRGTIPGTLAEGVNWANTLGRYAGACTRARHFIIGNETNHRQEWPGQVISPEHYARVYRLAVDAIKEARPDALVAPAPVAPWNVEAGDWLDYFTRLINYIGYQGAPIDFLALHTYTHGSDPALVTSEATMDPPFQDRLYHFRAYRQFMERIPHLLKDRPVLITETDQDEPWADRNTGWIRAAYREIAAWNDTPGTQKIQALILYRWPKDLDRWGMEHKPGVVEDFAQALSQNHTAPAPKPAPSASAGLPQAVLQPAPETTPPAPATVYLPNVGNGSAKPQNGALSPETLIPILARVIGVSPAVARGILAVESAGKYAGYQGRPLVRLEAHLLWRRWGQSDPDAYHRHFRFNDGPQPWTGHQWRPAADLSWRDFHGDQSAEYLALELARQLAGPVAYECASWGAAQILGSHYARLGYGSAAELVADFQTPAGQIAAFFAFINSDPVLAQAMRNRAWAQFARIYNGPGQVELYSRLIAEAVAREEARP